MGCKSVCTYCMFVTCVVFLVASIAFLVYWPFLYFSLLKSQLQLTPTSQSYPSWYEPPLPMYFEMYFFNFTNTQEVAANHSIKPQLVELGPYVFREHRIKVNETWHDNHTVGYFLERTWFFEEEMSNGTLDDEITSINVVLATIGYALRGTGSFAVTLLNTLLTAESQSMFVTKTARELLFDGYDDYILDLAKNLSSINIPNLPLDIPMIPFDKFGWFVTRNGSATYDGEFSIHTGTDDINKLGYMDLWNRQNKTRYYGEGCNNVYGSPGDLWPLNMAGDSIDLFINDICGTIVLKREGQLTAHGITANMFIGDDSVFDNGWHYPEKQCFCPVDGSPCPASGALNIAACRFDAPAYLSFPHFYLADQSYIDRVEGLMPDREKHEFRMALEPTLGIPLQVRAAMQINIRVHHLKGMNIINNGMPEITLPMLWFKQDVSITENLASQARMILDLETGLTIFFYCLLSVSLIGIFTAIAIVMKKRFKEDPETALLVENQN